MNVLHAEERRWVFSPLTIGDLRCLERAGPGGGILAKKSRAWLAARDGMTLAAWLSLRHRHPEITLETAERIVAGAFERVDRVLAAVLGVSKDENESAATSQGVPRGLNWPALYRGLLARYGLAPAEVDQLTLEQLAWLAWSEDAPEDDWIACHDLQQVRRLRARRGALSDAQAERLTHLPPRLRRQIHTLDDAAWSRFVAEQLTC